MQSIFFRGIIIMVGVDMDNTFTMITKSGEIEYEILATFKMEKTNKNYLVYTDNTYSDGKLNIYANMIDESENLKDIETDEEWAMVEKVLSKSYLKE